MSQTHFKHSDQLIQLKDLLINTGRVDLVSWQKAEALNRLWFDKNSHADPQDMLQLFFFCLIAWDKGHGVFSRQEFESIIRFGPDERVILSQKQDLELPAQDSLQQDFNTWWDKLESIFEVHSATQAGVEVLNNFQMESLELNPNSLLYVMIDPSQNALSFTLPQLLKDQSNIVQGVRELMQSSSVSESPAPANDQVNSEKLSKCVLEVLKSRQELIPQDKEPHYRQTLAAIMACYQDFMVITGGPGTGKTTVAKLVLWAIKNMERLEPQDITLAAPTGRARGRLVESLNSELQTTEQKEFFSQIEARTLHSLLGIGFRREIKPINAKIILVDECSMMDLRMFSRLLSSLNPGTKLILLGDKDQLPSVSAGQILADVTSAFVQIKGDQVSTSSLNASTMKCIQENWDFEFPSDEIYHGDFELQNYVVFLTKTFRSSTEILNWWQNPQDNTSENISEEVWDIQPDSWNKEAHVELRKSKIQEYVSRFQKAKTLFRNLKLKGDSLYSLELSTNPETSLLTLMDQINTSFRILCAHNTGWLGVKWFNEECLKEFSGHSRAAEIVGTPIMVKRNQRIRNYTIANGDIGFIGKVQGEKQFRMMMVYGSEVISIPLNQISEWDYAFAISIHKSQGSEFNEIVVATTRSVDSPLWTRQLIYTGVTRAKKGLSIIYPSQGSFQISHENNSRGSLIRFQQ